MSSQVGQCVDEIARQIGIMVHAAPQRRTMPEFLELVDEAEEWVAKMRQLIGDYE